MQRKLSSTIGLTTIFLLLLSSVYILAAPSVRWVRVITLNLYPDGTKGIYSVDNSSIKSRGNFRYYWFGLVYTKPVRVNEQGKNLSISTIVAYASINCSNKDNFQVYEVNVYDQNNKIITTQQFKNGTTYLPAQGTKLTGTYVCSRK
jgi:hypothetical protein